MTVARYNGLRRAVITVRDDGLANGPIEGHIHHDKEREKVVMHTCDNRPCCNPKHLRLGTDADMIAKGRAPWQRAKRDGLSEQMEKTT